MGTGENEQGLRKIMDFTRLLSISVLTIHLYLFCYDSMEVWGLTAPITDRLLLSISKIVVFNSMLSAKGSALLLLAISLFGTRGKKSENTSLNTLITNAIAGVAIYFLSVLFLGLEFPESIITACYIGFSSLGYIIILTSGAQLSRILKINFADDVFNDNNETFPQEERKIDNEYSINLPAQYRINKKTRNSWINIINPFRGILILGTPGSGKSYFIIRHIITQHIKKGFSMFIYDFKYDDLTKIAFNTLLKHNNQYSIQPKFYVINFEDMSRTHRCNPLDPDNMTDLTDATEASRTIMLGLNREWIKKQGDFFVESPINFLTAVIWYLRKYQDGLFCTLPHVIELIQVEYKDLFELLSREPQIDVLINPFISAWKNQAYDQLEGQVASAKISLARLSSPDLYYVLSGNDFTLDLNNPNDPKIVCMGNNPMKQQVYGAVLSLYISRMIKLVNQKNKQKCSLIFDEFPTIFFNNIDSLIATARSNKVATTLTVQDYSQLKKDYGKEQAEVILNIAGNVLSGQVSGDTAKQLSERFGKILQKRQSISTNSTDTSYSQSAQLEFAVPASKIASLSSGEFVGMVADDPHTRIDLKIFHNEIKNDHELIRTEESSFNEYPEIRQVDRREIFVNYCQIKQDIQELLAQELGQVNEQKQSHEVSDASSGELMQGLQI
ncbi:MAG: conjugal transfer protein TraG [Sphingobacteriales bacterium]|nr:conjugal transfer protein TraG [Sphingobacteriales bacterium]